MANELSRMYAAKAPAPPIPGRTAPYVQPGPHTYNTALPLGDELAFRSWIDQNQVPFNADAGTTDYDMRGFWQGLRDGSPRAVSAVNPNDSRLHYPDYWKTPYHETFSGESQWATDVGPQWDEQDRLIAPSGKIILDERRQAPSTLADMFRR